MLWLTCIHCAAINTGVILLMHLKLLINISYKDESTFQVEKASCGGKICQQSGMFGDLQIKWHGWNRHRIGTEVGEESSCEPAEGNSAGPGTLISSKGKRDNRIWFLCHNTAPLFLWRVNFVLMGVEKAENLLL